MGQPCVRFARMGEAFHVSKYARYVHFETMDLRMLPLEGFTCAHMGQEPHRTLPFVRFVTCRRQIMAYNVAHNETNIRTCALSPLKWSITSSAGPTENSRKEAVDTRYHSIANRQSKSIFRTYYIQTSIV
jgi:hypothetical protein